MPQSELMRLDGEMENSAFRARVGTRGGLGNVAGLVRELKCTVSATEREFRHGDEELAAGTDVEVNSARTCRTVRVHARGFGPHVNFWSRRIQDSGFRTIPARSEFGRPLEGGRGPGWTSGGVRGDLQEPKCWRFW